MTIRQLPQAIADVAFDGVRIVIANPGFEQIPQDVEHPRLRRFLGEKSQEALIGCRGLCVQMQVRDEQLSHGPSVW